MLMCKNKLYFHNETFFQIFVLSVNEKSVFHWWSGIEFYCTANILQGRYKFLVRTKSLWFDFRSNIEEEGMDFVQIVITPILWCIMHGSARKGSMTAVFFPLTYVGVWQSRNILKRSMRCTLNDLNVKWFVNQSA